MLKILELFGGIGACSKALERLGIEYEIVDYVEIDKYAVKSFNAIHNTNFEPQDICNWDKNIEVDLIMHGSPCQDFSLAGKQAGGDKYSGTRSSLMYETIRIVEKLKPKYVIWENVKNILSKKHRHNFNNYLKIMEQLGYKNYYQVLNAKDYGIPQNRERVFTVSILGNENYEFPKGNILYNKIKKIADLNTSYEQSGRIYDVNGLSPTIMSNSHNGGYTPIKILEKFTFPQKQELKLKLKDILEDEVEEKYYINDCVMNSIISDNQVGYLSGGKWDKINESCRRYYKVSGISPTIHTCQGGNTEPKIILKGFVTKKYNSFVNKNGYVPEMFNPYNEKEIKEIAPTQNTYCGSSTSSATVLINNNLRIRKLTPKECWRLMGFDDEDFEKAKERIEKSDK